MKKSLIFVSLLAFSLLVPFSAFADTGSSASSGLFISKAPHQIPGEPPGLNPSIPDTPPDGSKTEEEYTQKYLEDNYTKFKEAENGTWWRGNPNKGIPDYVMVFVWNNSKQDALNIAKFWMQNDGENLKKAEPFPTPIAK
ncbi:hypothetical protein SAMN05444392_108125 [Seinonella peptonophila]|uniref:Uncharacterized protein n=1 Tax=Seinonella peptonophila TaxID=112248 RepID=A0A1M4Z9S5_9BACL|nr:hypothetical protein [Seinonella peptonophila]SHF14790.1 hypothetical protein SAMN05444392_108125 [Seinonella peptonophila]